MTKKIILKKLQDLVRKYTGNYGIVLLSNHLIEDYIPPPVQFNFSGSIWFNFKKVDKTDLVNSIGEMVSFEELINYIFDAYSETEI